VPMRQRARALIRHKGRSPEYMRRDEGARRRRA
jgi:hypothetical protein